MATLLRPGLATAVGAAVLLALAPAAAARERDVPGETARAPMAAPGHAQLNDTVLEEPVAEAAGASGPTRAYTTTDGHRVNVRVSRAYPADVAADRALVDYLDSLVHGPELGSLSVYVGAPAEIRRLCGGAGAVACYAVHARRMYVPGEAARGVPVEYVLAHEYGHHIASVRSNSPWNALDWGAKHWASAMRVCSHVDAGRLFPGDQGRNYLSDPGEGFADGYAHLHFRRVPWQYDRLMRPDPAAFAAIRRDVLDPWTGPQVRTFAGRLGPGARSVRRFHFRMRLDGTLRVRLSTSARTRAHVSVRAGDRTVAAGRTLRADWCRRRPQELATVTVRREAGAGRFALRVSWAG